MMDPRAAPLRGSSGMTPRLAAKPRPTFEALTEAPSARFKRRMTSLMASLRSYYAPSS